MIEPVKTGDHAIVQPAHPKDSSQYIGMLVIVGLLCADDPFLGRMRRVRFLNSNPGFSVPDMLPQSQLRKPKLAEPEVLQHGPKPLPMPPESAQEEVQFTE